ncbi:MAG: nucleoside hydrolase, partial [Thermomicrobiales bacterium]
MKPLDVVIDTDIGADPDDAIAVALAVASPELRVRGVTIVSGDVDWRARIATRLLGMLGRPDIPVIRGIGAGGMLGIEGQGMLDREYRGPEATVLQHTTAAHWLIEQSHSAPFHLVAIGPLTNVAEANLFGLEPHFGCCTANMHQGWPKYAASLWMRSVDESLVGISYAPCTVTTILNGHELRAVVETNYPFEDVIRISIHSEFAGQQVSLRIPEWATAASLSLNGVAQNQPVAGTFQDLRLDEAGDHEIVLDLNPAFRSERRFNESVSIFRGSLLYALPIEDEWRKVIARDPVSDWELHPLSPWNYALALEAETIGDELALKRTSGPAGFAANPGILSAQVQGRQVPAWRIEHNAAGPVPESPVASGEPLEQLTLVPYGSTKLRIG